MNKILKIFTISGLFLGLFLITLFFNSHSVEAVNLSMSYDCPEVSWPHADGAGNPLKTAAASSAGCSFYERYLKYKHPYDIGGNVPTVPNPSECIRNGAFANCTNESRAVVVWDTWYGTTPILRQNLPAVSDSGNTTVTLNKQMYFQGETITVSASGGYTVKCGNNAPVIVKARINGVTQTIISQTIAGDGSTYTNYPLSPKSKTFTAPNTCGSHTAEITFQLTHGGTMTRTKTIPYTVKCRPSTAVTSPSNGSSFAEGEQINFTGVPTKGAPGGTWTGYVWVDVVPGTPSDTGTVCRCVDGVGGTCISGATGTSFNTSSLSEGSHKLCFNARQSYTDGTTRWSDPTGRVSVTINNEGEGGEECENGDCGGGGGGGGNLLVCGNGLLEPSNNEFCDDGNVLDGDGCTSNCLVEGTGGVVCGNGVIEEGEECDGGNYCDIYCNNITPNECGNGVLEEANGEECDDGNSVDGDECTNSCQLGAGYGNAPRCGNGECEQGENFLTCPSDCTADIIEF